MNQRVLHRSVARATGETVSEIARRGFSLTNPSSAKDELEPLPEAGYIDWDEFALHQNTAVFDQPVASLVGHV